MKKRRLAPPPSPSPSAVTYASVGEVAAPLPKRTKREVVGVLQRAGVPRLTRELQLRLEATLDAIAEDAWRTPQPEDFSRLSLYLGSARSGQKMGVAWAITTFCDDLEQRGDQTVIAFGCSNFSDMDASEAMADVLAFRTGLEFGRTCSTFIDARSIHVRGACSFSLLHPHTLPERIRNELEPLMKELPRVRIAHRDFSRDLQAVALQAMRNGLGVAVWGSKAMDVQFDTESILGALK